MIEINRERLAETFVRLCETDSPSWQERKVADLLKDIFAVFDCDVEEDESAAVTGSDCGNLLVRFQGGSDTAPVFFNCHMDTVLPAIGVEVVRQGDVFTSRGKTVLGGDDKSGIAALIEVMQLLRENKIRHGPVEFLFTTCEEVGLLGAKAFDYSRLRSKTGYALDSTGTDRIIIGAPASNRIDIEVFGASAHAGLNPEKGINAIQLAAKAVAELTLGRLDHESTANIGIVAGGKAPNIIPEKVLLKGELRSHSEEKLAAFTGKMQQTFKTVIDNWQDDSGLAQGKPRVEFTVFEEYPALKLNEDDGVIQLVKKAEKKLDRTLNYLVAGGGSDANIFSSHGIRTAIISTGMNHVHSTEENIDLNDMVRTAELVQAIILSC